MSQGICESRVTIYDERANSVLSICLKALIKKIVHVFLQRVVRVLLPRWGGAHLFTNWKKAMYNWKNKN